MNPNPPLRCRPLDLPSAPRTHLRRSFSPSVSIIGLIASRNLPLSNFFRAAREFYGAGAAWRFPSLGLLGGRDAVLRLCWAEGGGASRHRGSCAVRCSPCRGSVSVARRRGPGFLSFQWDILLLETGFLRFFRPIAIPSETLCAAAPPRR